MALLGPSQVGKTTLARSLAVDGKTILRYFDLMVDMLLARRLPPYHINVGKRALALGVGVGCGM